VVSELESRKRREDENRGNPYLYYSLGVGFVIVTILVIVTSGTAAAGLPFVIAAALFGIGLSGTRGQQRAVEPPISKERELLSAIRDNGGSITPAEAAMETSLTVSEADSMLSELAGGGHLAVESRDGALFYSLPGRRGQELEGR
jgi:hypothetical protein